MQAVGNTDIIGTARELHKRQRSDIAVAVTLAAEQGGFERMLGAEQPSRTEKPAERPREETAPSTRRPADDPAAPQARPAAPDARRGAKSAPGEAPVREPASAPQRPATGEVKSAPIPVQVRPADVPVTRPQDAGETIPKPIPVTTDGGAAKPAVPTHGTRAEPAPDVPQVPTRDAGYARLLGQQGQLQQAAARIQKTDDRPSLPPAPAVEAKTETPPPVPDTPHSAATREMSDLGVARAAVGHGAEATPPPEFQPAATIAFDPQPLATPAPQPASVGATAEAVLAEPAAPEASAQISQQVRAQVLSQMAGRLGGLGGKGSLRLSLTPPELGRVEVRFTRDAGRLSLTFRVESAVAARALQDGAGQLQELLLGQNSSWQQVEIAVEREGEDAEKRNQSEQRERNRREEERREAQDEKERGGES